MNGKIALKGLVFHSFHGVHGFEREKGNEFRVDLVFEADISKASVSDRLADTLDYEEVYEIVAEIMQVPVNLLEHVAHRITESLMSRYPAIISMETTVAKKFPPLPGHCDESSVTLVSTR